MGQISQCLIGLTYSPRDVRDFGTLVLRSSNVQNGRLEFDDNVFVDMDIPMRAITRENDILICVRNGSRQLIGKCALIDDRTAGSAFGAFMSVLRSDSAKFLFFQFQSSIQKRQIDEVMGATINQITNKDMAAFKVIWPSTKAEQVAIAEALSDADALIESLEQLLSKKRNIKQGAMQELLTGKKRLPGFSGEWEVKRLGDVVEIRKGELITEKNAVRGPIPVIAGGKKPAYFHDRANRPGKTITISGSGASAGYVAFFDIPIFASDCSTIGESARYSVEFFYFVMLLNQSAIYNAQTGGAQPHIHPNDLRPLLVGVPESKEEQTAIAAILSDMDAEIAALEAKLVKARSVKQGMMQELLTGRIRLI